MKGTWYSPNKEELSVDELLVLNIIFKHGNKPFTTNSLIRDCGLIEKKVNVHRGISGLHFHGLIKEIDRTVLLYASESETLYTKDEAVYRCSGIYRDRLHAVYLNNGKLDVLKQYDKKLRLYPYHIDRHVKLNNIFIYVRNGIYHAELGTNPKIENLIGHNIQALLKA